MAMIHMVPDLAERNFSHLRQIVYGASPINSALLQSALKVFDCDFYQVYGMTETCGAVVSLSAEDHRRAGQDRPELLASCGRPQAGIDVKVVNDQGEQLDSSRVEGREPLAYLEGAQNIIGGLESALTEKNAGDQVKVSVEPAEGYGEVNEELIQPVPRSAFEGVDTIEPGMQFQAQTPGGPQVVRVVEVGDETVTIDANHPLAGQTLHFDVEVVETREATDEEQEHGHVH